MATAATGKLTVTLAELVRRLADEFGDLVRITTTSAGDAGGTTAIDSQAVNTGKEDLGGRQIYFTSGANNTEARTITSTTDTTNTITFIPAATAQVASGVTAEVYNKRGHGFLRDEYVRALNRAIDDAAGIALIAVVDTDAVPGNFDKDSPEITVDTQISEVFKVEHDDADGFWYEVRKAPRWGGDGWVALPASGKIRLTGKPAWDADGNTVQVWGYGRQAALSASADTVAMDPGWLIARAAFHLAKGNLDRRPELGGLLMLYRDEAVRREGALRVIRHPDAAPVRG